MRNLGGGCDPLRGPPLYFSGFVQAGVLVAGLLWCGAMLRRWRSDLEELRTAREAGARTSMVLLWAFTVCVVLVLLRIVTGVVLAFASA